MGNTFSMSHPGIFHDVPYLTHSDNKLVVSNDKIMQNVNKKQTLGSVFYFRICFAWFLVSTFSIISVRIPASSKMNVARIVPIYFLP